MPPLTPSTTRGPLRSLICGPCPLSPAAGASGLRAGGRLGLGLGIHVLAGEQVVVDLAQRDGQGLLLHVRVDERSDVLQQTLAELGVVGVDLAGALGAVEDQLVLAVGLGEQVVDRGVGDTLGGDGGSGHAWTPHRSVGDYSIKATNSSAAA